MNDEPGIPAKLRSLLETFDTIDDMDLRMSMLVSYAGQFREVPPEVASRPFPADARVPFCESEAFVWAIPEPGGSLKLHFAVENPSGVSARALSAILEKTISGAPAAEIARISPDIVSRIFRQNISMGKGMGLMGIVERVRELASASLRTKSTV
ncbi:MAG TPA: SufE family protein [Bacteroidota bacterium]|nr:SufE family protein [Bacteroidota bacterium]